MSHIRRASSFGVVTPSISSSKSVMTVPIAILIVERIPDASPWNIVNHVSTSMAKASLSARIAS